MAGSGPLLLSVKYGQRVGITKPAWIIPLLHSLTGGEKAKVGECGSFIAKQAGNKENQSHPESSFEKSSYPKGYANTCCRTSEGQFTSYTFLVAIIRYQIYAQSYLLESKFQCENPVLIRAMAHGGEEESTPPSHCCLPR
ncbi:UNVERIFIED_CONTAM: hypothetical protein K2H54_040615 [Gekko kuhli]